MEAGLVVKVHRGGHEAGCHRLLLSSVNTYSTYYHDVARTTRFYGIPMARLSALARCCERSELEQQERKTQ